MFKEFSIILPTSALTFLKIGLVFPDWLVLAQYLTFWRAFKSI